MVCSGADGGAVCGAKAPGDRCADHESQFDLHGSESRGGPEHSGAAAVAPRLCFCAPPANGDGNERGLIREDGCTTMEFVMSMPRPPPDTHPRTQQTNRLAEAAGKVAHGLCTFWKDKLRARASPRIDAARTSQPFAARVRRGRAHGVSNKLCCFERTRRTMPGHSLALACLLACCQPTTRAHTKVAGGACVVKQRTSVALGST